MILAGYNVTEQEVKAYIATLNLESLKLNLTVANKREVFQDGVLWYVTNADTTAEKEIQFQLDNTVYSLCCEHFADRRMDPIQPSQQQTNEEKILQQNEVLMLALAEQYEKNLVIEENQQTIMLAIADLYESQNNATV